MEIIKCFMEGDKYSPLYKITPSSEEEERFLDALLKAYKVFDEEYYPHDEFFDDENFEPFNG